MDRPCECCIRRDEYGCIKWECEPVTLEQAREIVRKAMKERNDGA